MLVADVYVSGPGRSPVLRIAAERVAGQGERARAGAPAVIFFRPAAEYTAYFVPWWAHDPAVGVPWEVVLPYIVGAGSFPDLFPALDSNPTRSAASMSQDQVLDLNLVLDEASGAVV